ncbi:MAG: aldehyde dehydrogenase family protein [Desulfobacterales bacterium]|nr:MAG: aldehyde dehydrogenase family protein [Desulfobacterales bacterium]
MASVPTVKMLINGNFVESDTPHFEDVVNPATQEVLARVPFSTEDEIEAAVPAARLAFQTWKNTPISARARIFFKLQELIRNNLDRLAESITAELGKIRSDAEGDVFRGLEVVEHACGIPSLQMGGFVENVAKGVNTFTMLQPLGVCAGITPFNFPGVVEFYTQTKTITERWSGDSTKIGDVNTAITLK